MPISHCASPKMILLIFLCTIITILNAQTQSNKISLGLHRIIQEPSPNARAGKIPVLIRGDVNAITQYIITNNGKVKFVTKNIVSATIDPALVTLLNEKEFVAWIDCPTGKLVPLNDVMVKRNNIDSAFYGYWPLEQGYDGSGVVIGIIDAPTDYAHPDFNDAFGNTRIQYLWDQNVEGTFPGSFDYGNECDSASIAEGNCSHADIEGYYSHGTGVAGVAASSNYQYRGVAPNADLIFVSLDFGGEFLSNTVDAIAYVFEKAEEMGKPCVINTSFGSYAGSHDGRDITAQAIAELVSAQNGRAVVSAAGNAGANAIHLGYDVTATEHFTWFKKLSYLNAVYFQVWADSSDFDDVIFSLAADNATDFSFKGSTPDYNVISDFDLSGGFGFNTYDVFDGATLMGTVETYVQNVNGTYLLEVYIASVTSANYWRFTTSGEGKFDIYSTEGFTGYSNYVTTGLPDAGTLPDIVNYKMPDLEQNIVSSWQCLDEVITVGSYVNRDSMTNYYGENPPFFDLVGEIYISSSHGPTRDERIKPDITATGARVLSSGSQLVTDWLISLGAANYISQDGQHFLQNGTSFASPVITGIAALYLQKNPDAGHAEIKNAILSNAKKDIFTGDDLPDNEWGYGKADGFRTLTGPWGCTADDYLNAPDGLEVITLTATGVEVQWDIIPNAAHYQVVIQNTSIPQKIKRIAGMNQKIINMLSPSTEYSCRVRAICEGLGYSNWSAPVFFTTLPLKENIFEVPMISVYPNPAANTITIDGLSPGNNQMLIFNLMGEKVMEKTMQTEQGDVMIDLQGLSDGMYTLIIENASTVVSEKILIVK
ncbi:MAG: S8 family serine peptidase [Chitinophagales bacterium]|nr:S8 family serine peptidase [Chitinophagales bacterium]